MASTTKRSIKLQEFVAHGGNVNCAALGHDSGRVLVSGGEDKKVNLWAVGKDKCILSLSGHTSPIEAVRFRPDEKAVIAGSLSGSVKIWDLEAVKILRTLTGHKSAVRCIDYHPFNDFLITGSLDTNIKVWDMRRKTCLYTYFGHSNCVNCVRFSPDSQWMASGGDDGLVKIWDMSTAKQLAEFRQHSGPVNTLQFHPNDLLLASGSSDRTVKFWDLDSMQMVGSTDGDSTPIRSLLFHPQEECLYSASIDFLKVYGWEPSRCFDSVSVGWGRSADIATVDTQLVGVSFSQSSLSTFVVDIQKVQPLGGPPYQDVSVIPTQSTASVHRRRSFLAERPPVQCGPIKISEDESGQSAAAAAAAAAAADDPEEDNASGFEINDISEYKQVFRPKHELPRGPSPFSMTQDDKKGTTSNLSRCQQKMPQSRVMNCPQSSQPALESLSSEKDSQPYSAAANSSARQPPVSLAQPHPVPESRVRRPPTSCSKTSRNNADNIRDNMRNKAKRSLAEDDSKFARSARTGSEDRGAVIKDRSVRPSAEDVGLRTKDMMESKQKGFSALADIFPDQCHISDVYNANAGQTGGPRENQSKGQRFEGQETSPDRSSNYKITSKRIDADDFLLPPSGDVAELTAIDSISSGHDALMAVLTARNRNLLVIKTLWTTGNIKTVVEAAVGMNDPAVIHDVVNMMLQKSSTWNLDHCTSLLPILGNLISSKYDNYINTGLIGIKLVLRSFAPIIRANIMAPPPVGVDISREERANKCLFCHKQLMKIRSEVNQRAMSGPSTGDRALHYKEIQLLMNQLD